MHSATETRTHLRDLNRSEIDFYYVPEVYCMQLQVTANSSGIVGDFPPEFRTDEFFALMGMEGSAHP